MTLFCDIELAARIERAECHLLSEACAMVARRVEGVLARPVCGGFASFTEPDSPLNKVCGLGFAGSFDERDFGELERECAARGAELRVDLATLADPGVGQWLTARGFELHGVENVLGLRLPSAPETRVREDVHVEVSGAGELDRWLAVVVEGFAVPDTQGVPSDETLVRDVLTRVIRDFTSSDQVVRYLARRAGALAGGGALRMGEGLAQLCGASTLPQERRHGVQTALLARRLDDAARNGCEFAVMTAQPGSKSQQNAQRRGFELLYSRNVLRKRAP